MNDVATDPTTTPAEKAYAIFREDSVDLLKQPAFRRWLFHITDDGDWCASHACRENFENVNETFYSAGRRSIGVQLLVHAQQVAPVQAMHMISEARNLALQRAAMSPLPET